MQITKPTQKRDRKFEYTYAKLKKKRVSNKKIFQPGRAHSHVASLVKSITYLKKQ
jgi:hypothetical protein